MTFITFTSKEKFFLRMINGKEDWRRISEKYAYYNLKKTDTTVWFHGASVGES